MINVKPEIYAELKKVTSNVNDSYPSDWATFPVVQYIEEENKTSEKTDDREQKAYIRFKIDIRNNRSTSSSATLVDELISALGLVRTQCLDVTDTSQLKHKVMRFEGTIDVDRKSVV